MAIPSALPSVLVVVLLLSGALAADWSSLNAVMQEAIADRAFPGAVVAVSNESHLLFQKTYGSLTYEPDLQRVPVTNDTRYDAASMTKIMATTLAIMNLVSSKSISVDDPVTKYIDNYDTNKKGNTTIKNLLLHNAGLPYDYPGALPNSQDEVIDYIRFLKPAYPIGSKFSYSNLGFLLLGKIVEKITKRNFSDYTNQNRIFAGLKDTGFNPAKSEWYHIAPTEYDIHRKQIIRGEVHERLAYFFDGVAGHSGYFTTATDVLRYMRMLLNEGKLPEEVRTLPASIVQEFTTVVKGLDYENTRGLGFDTYCPSKKMSNCFGHDGSTGMSGWVDRDKKIAFAITSNRGHPDAKNNKYFEVYKQKISDAIMEALGY